MLVFLFFITDIVICQSLVPLQDIFVFGFLLIFCVTLQDKEQQYSFLALPHDFTQAIVTLHTLARL